MVKRKSKVIRGRRVKHGWREAADAADPHRRGSILRAIADLQRTTPKELSDVLDRAKGLSEEASIAWAVLHNKNATPSIRKQASKHRARKQRE